ncbi:MAG: hypothetical protein PHR47_00710 [Candidatus Pacebacteria bacterium]|nr:hypothetical protein [Candidatus Paceibacterota bacterium]
MKITDIPASVIILLIFVIYFLGLVVSSFYEIVKKIIKEIILLSVGIIFLIIIHINSERFKKRG